MAISRMVGVCFVLGAALFVGAASAADVKSCPPLRGVVLHPKATDHGYLLPVDVAGTHRMFLLDLGHAYSKLDEAVAMGLKLPLKKAPFVVEDERGAFAQVATIPSIKLGAVTRGESQMLVGAHRDSWGSADGLAGMNMFSGFDVELDLLHNRLGLYLPRDCSFQPFWPAEVFGQSQFKIEGTGRIILPLKLDGQDIEADLRMVSQESEMPLEAARILFGIDKDDPHLTPAGKNNQGDDVFLFPFKTLTGGEKVTVGNPRIFVVSEKGMLCSGVAGQRQAKDRARRGDIKWCSGGGDIGLGLNLLERLHIFFSTNDKKVFFTASEPLTRPASPEAKSQ